MKKIIIFSLFLCITQGICAEQYKKFVILIASYNNEKYVKGNIYSALQDYPEDHYRIIYIDDCSSDATSQKLEACLKNINKPNLITVIRNETRKGALYNHWFTINNFIEDDEIVVILDGDDKLIDPHVLSYLNTAYSTHDIWLTYGQYQEMHSKQIGFNKAMPQHVVAHNSFREYQDIPSHLRTFYAKLYKNIRIDDLLLNGEFLSMCADMATGIPMIEMARDHFMFIPKVLYLYNDKNPLSDHRISRTLQAQIDRYVRNKNVYEPLEKLF